MALQDRLFDGGIPKPSIHIEKELKSLNPRLHVVRSKYMIDSNGRMHKDGNGNPIVKPRYWVALGDEVLFPVESPEGEFLPVDQRLLFRLRSDVGRSMSPKEITELLKARSIEEKEKSEFEASEMRRRLAENNRPAWKRAQENALNGVFSAPGEDRRDEKLFSYPGQVNRSAGRMSVKKSAKEQGIDTFSDS